MDELMPSIKQTMQDFKQSFLKTFGNKKDLRQTMINTKSDLIGKTVNPETFGSGKIVNVDFVVATETFLVCIERKGKKNLWYQWVRLSTVEDFIVKG
jgi:hypothetical protein